jgi:Swt1-like HEPN
MSTDDPLKKFIASHDALRHVTNPLADSLRHLDTVAEFRRLMGIDDSAIRMLEQVTGNSRLLGLTHDLRLPEFDTTGLANLALQADSHRKMLAPFADYAKYADITSPLAKELSAAASAFKDYERQFCLPEWTEAARLVHESMTSASRTVKLLGLDFENSLKSAMISMDMPWLRSSHLAESVRGFSELQAIGAAINLRLPYEDALSSVLRDALGDWRQVSVLPPTIFDNPVARSDFYVGLGFDSSLTEFTPQAFDESMAIAGIGPTEVEPVAEDGESGVARNIRAYRYLLEFENKVREFIDRVMTETFGPDWVRHQTPTEMLDSWKAKRQAAIEKGEDEQPLIAYADFTDYIRIIERKDNWSKVFEAFFLRRTDVQESFMRLFPVRICTMHAWIITLDDELFLRAESRRILRAIGN